MSSEKHRLCWVRGEQELRTVSFLLSIILAVALVCPAAARPTVFGTISWNPSRIASGSPCLFKVALSSPPAKLSGKWQGSELAFFPSGDPRVWYALAGVDVETKPGFYKLELTATLPNGQVIRTQQNVVVNRAKYRTEVLHVPDRFVEPDAAETAQIESDRQIKKAAFAHEEPVPEWSGKFRPPIDTPGSDSFGTRRTFNGKLESIHRGMDYHAAMGTPVSAANSGEVVLARDLFYEGNCVVIDHGQGFMSIYMHLSQFKVVEGQKVEKGQEIALSGDTGRATGPHLHVAVRWQGAYLDPAQLWRMAMPNLQLARESTGSPH